MLPICILTIEDESDREFMADLFLNYQWLMYRTIEQIVQDHWIAEDVAQSTLVKLIDKIDKLKSLDEPHRINYIITACKHAALNELRSRSRHPMFSIDENWDADSGVHAVRSMELNFIHEEDLRHMAQVWGDLDPRSQYVLEARYILEKSDAEIADALEVKPDSVRMLLTRARKKVYDLMTPPEPDAQKDEKKKEKKSDPARQPTHEK